ncbi:MAG: DUF881 domain-containing protein [Aeromicrobium sp.]
MAKTGTHARQHWPVAVLTICVLAGGLFAAAAVTSDGSDLRPAGGDVASLLQERALRVEQQRAQARELQQDIDDLSRNAPTGSSLGVLLGRLARLREVSGLRAASGPGVRVSLTDAPRSVDVPGLDPNVLVVHQQDIQAFVNALWSGGAEAVSLQGQRLISTTGIKCVGSTVVLDGVPYSPPYVIEAIGDPARLNQALDESPEVVIYREYVTQYQLGLKTTALADIAMKAYGGTVSLTHARALPDEAA